MNQIERDICVKQNHNNFERISYVQSTNEIPIVLHIRDYSIPSGSTARVYVRRPDGTSEYDTAVLSGNDVTINVKDTMFSVAGKSKMQVRIAKGSKKLVSFAIDVNVEKNYAVGDVKSENVTDIFDEAFSGLEEATKKAEQAVETIQEKADKGDFTSSVQIGKVTTGDPGTQASAKNVGTKKDAVIDMTIPRGNTGVSMRMKGAWTSGTPYVNNTSYIDLVTYEGSTYGCKRTHTASDAILPTNEGYWECIAKKGETGSIENLDTIPIDFQAAIERANIQPNDSIPVAFGKFYKLYADLEKDVLGGLKGNVQDQIDGLKVFSHSEMLSGPGWRRLVEFNIGTPTHTSSVDIGGDGNVFDIMLTHGYNNHATEACRISLSLVYNKGVDYKLLNYNGRSNVFEYIRITMDSEKKTGYLEVFYSVKELNRCGYTIRYSDCQAGEGYEFRNCKFEPADSNEEPIWGGTINKSNSLDSYGKNGRRKLAGLEGVPTNLDDMLSDEWVGSYGSTGNAFEGLPSGITKLGILDVTQLLGGDGGDYIRQIYQPYDQDVLLMRRKNPDSNTVTDWGMFYPNGVKVLPVGTDLNTLIITGNWLIPNSAQYLNCPSPSGYTAFLEVLNCSETDETIIIQKWNFFSLNQVYTRTASGRTWNPWRLVGGDVIQNVNITIASGYFQYYSENSNSAFILGDKLFVSIMFFAIRKFSNGEWLIYAPDGYEFAKSEQVVVAKRAGYSDAELKTAYAKAGDTHVFTNFAGEASNTDYYRFEGFFTIRKL